jgi:hypothetical protein
MLSTTPKSWACSLLLLATVCASANAHGFVTQPRCRGSLRSQRGIVPPVMDPEAPIDYCPHCQNCGGVGGVRKGGPWKMYAPFEYSRRGITMCGDPVGKDDHTSKGQYANPASMPFAATYAPGSVANFECKLSSREFSVASWFATCFLNHRSDALSLIIPRTYNIHYAFQMIFPQITMGFCPSTCVMFLELRTRTLRMTCSSSRKIATNWSAVPILAASLEMTKRVARSIRSTQVDGWHLAQI